MAGVNELGRRIVLILVFGMLAFFAVGATAFAQGSTGGTIGFIDRPRSEQHPGLLHRSQTPLEERTLKREAPRRNIVVNWHSGPTGLDRYLSKCLAPHLPVITLCNPAAGSPIMGGNDLATLRLEVPNRAWASVVRLLISAAQLIIIEALLDGPGLREELRFIHELDRSADTVVVLSSIKQREEILRQRLMSGVAADQDSYFVSSASPLLEGFGRIHSLPDIEQKEPGDTIAFQGLFTWTRTS